MAAAAAAGAPWMAWRKRMMSRSKQEETEKSRISESRRSKAGEEEEANTQVDGFGSSSSSIIMSSGTGTFCGSQSYGKSTAETASCNLQNSKKNKKTSSSSSKRGGCNGGGPAYICCNNLKGVVHGNTRVVHRGDQDSPLSLPFSSTAVDAFSRPATPVFVRHIDDDDGDDKWTAVTKDSLFVKSRSKLSTSGSSCYDCSASLSCEPTDFLRHSDGGGSRYHSLQLLQPARHSFSHPPASSSSSSASSGSKPGGGHAYGCCSAEDYHGSAHCYLQLQHHAPHHSVRELREGDSARSIVEIIFQTSWPAARRQSDNYYSSASSSASASTRVRIESMFKVQSSSRALARFEEHRDMVKAKASRLAVAAASSRRNSGCRCLVDGNEQLRFHATTAACDLGRHQPASLCTAAACGVCTILRHGFPSNGGAAAAGIHTNASSGRAHTAGGGGGGGGGRRWRWAMLVCRVIAGRVKRVEELGEDICSTMMVGADGVFDSVAAGGGREAVEVVEDLVVFNPRAVLPCFVVLYAAGGGGGDGGDGAG